MWRRRRQDVSTLRDAMRVLGASSPADLTRALDRRPGESTRTSDLDVALGLLEQWFQDLPPDRAHQPEMTFHEFVRLLRDALRAGTTPD